MRFRPSVASLVLMILPANAAARAAETAPPPGLLQEMRWRMIGPFRGGRTVAAVGVPERPGLFFIGVNNGGVWKTTDYGRVWTPVFDDQPTGSIGALAIARSSPDVIYAGSGEGLQRPDLSTGDGLYRSADGGRTWTHLGLRDGQQIPAIIVDPRDPDRLLVAVLGHPYGPNPERGIFRSRDGGRTFEKVLYRDEDTGGMDLAFDPRNPDVVYAVLWEQRQAPWENGVFRGPGSGLYKSTDGGTTWKPLTTGLPGAADGLGRIGLATCASEPRRLYAIVGATKLGGLYRSDDAGESWRRVNEDTRLGGRDGDFNEVKADPKNADVVYVANIASWKSTDGGRTFTGFRGAPGGDDYHRIWIDPRDPRVILMASDQGAVITVNGGETWSSWYNQPTAQLYHVTADDAFPYRVCGGQQESGSACVSSRGAWGQVNPRDWSTAGFEEYGYGAPDPLDPDVVYGGRISRFDRRTGQSQDVSPRVLRRDGYRVLRTAPIVFSAREPRVLYFGSEKVWRTRDGGRAWEAISPDLSRAEWTAPRSVGKYAGSEAAKSSRRGVVYTIAPSPLDTGRVWAGTDDGLIHTTADGGRTWTDVTPKELAPWSKVSLMDASHFDPLSAYAAVNTFRLDDLRPHVYRTHDGGKTWTRVVNGIPDGGIINVVREDPKRRGLLYAGSEQAVYVSFDDGDHWQSLRLNMPATSIRDLVVKDDDLVVGTHGRGFWVLDDVSPLRQYDPAVMARPFALLAPQAAWRVHWNLNTDTPLPPDEPAGENPPEGAVLHYWLKDAPREPVTLEVLDAAGGRVAAFSSTDTAEAPAPDRNFPDYWLRRPRILSAAAGLHRFAWDLRYPPPPARERGYPIAAVVANTPRTPRGPWVLPGTYTLRLTADGQRQEQPLVVRMDPRVKAAAADLRSQLDLSQRVVAAMTRVRSARETQGASTTPEAKAALDRLGSDLDRVYGLIQGADAAPTPAMVEAVEELERAAVLDLR